MESDKGASGARVDMVVGLLALGADAVVEAAVVVHTSALRSGVRRSWKSRDKN